MPTTTSAGWLKIVEIGSHHHPIRAQLVDGVGVTHLWGQVAAGLQLRPEFVTVPYSVVVAHCGGVRS